MVSTVDKVSETEMIWKKPYPKKSEAVGTVVEMNVKKRRGPKINFLDATESDMRTVGVCVDDVGDCIK